MRLLWCERWCVRAAVRVAASSGFSNSWRSVSNLPGGRSSAAVGTGRDDGMEPGVASSAGPHQSRGAAGWVVVDRGRPTEANGRSQVGATEED